MTREWGVEMENNQENKKEIKIRKELRRLKKIYANLPKNKTEIVFPLLENLAFMKITLEELQKSINENGCCDVYKNGKDQFGQKASAELQAYNSLIKNFNTVSDRLEKLLPPERKKSKLGMLMDE